MKKYLLPLAAFLSIIIAASFVQSKTDNGTSAEKIKWYSFSEAVELNKKKPKKIFIDIYTSWCGWCSALLAR